MLDEAGLRDAIVFASGGMDERDIEGLLAAGAPIDGFGVGSRLGTVADSPYLDMAYKLVAFDGRPTLKLSGSTAMWPGAKQIWRVAAEGAYARDVLGLAGEDGPQGGEPMLVEVMRRRETGCARFAGRRPRAMRCSECRVASGTAPIARCRALRRRRHRRARRGPLGAGCRRGSPAARFAPGCVVGRTRISAISDDPWRSSLDHSGKSSSDEGNPR